MIQVDGTIEKPRITESLNCRAVRNNEKAKKNNVK